MTRFTWKLGLVRVLAFAVAVSYGATDPLAAEFLANTEIANVQESAVVAVAPGGASVVAWASDDQDTDSWGVYAQRLDSSGSPVGNEIQVHTDPTRAQQNPAVAIDDAGNFVVTWQSQHVDPGTYFNVFAQRFDSSGNKLGGEFRVDAVAGGDVINPSVAMDALGNFVIAFEIHVNHDGDGYGIYARRYNSLGQSQGGGFRVNTYFTGNQTEPAVAMDDAGNFVIVWASDLQDGSLRGIYGQRFDAVGGTVGSEFPINETTTNDQYDPSVAMSGAGDFVVAWTGVDTSSQGIFAQRFANTGARVGCEFQVNTTETGAQDEPSAAIDDDGHLVFVWQDELQEGDYGVYGQVLDANGATQGSEFRVNTTTTGDQMGPAAGIDGSGRIVVAWDGNGPGDDRGIFRERLAGSVEAFIFAENTSSSTAANQSSLTWSHTVGDGADRFLSVGISFDGGAPGSTTVTYGGTPLTLLASLSAQNQVHVQLWGLTAPPTGAADIIVTLGSAEDFAAGATSFYGVDQSTPYGSWTANDGSGSPAVLNLTAAVGELMISAVAVDNGPVLTPSGCQAERWNTGPTSVTGATGTHPGSGSAVPMSWDFTGNNRWAMAAVPLKPAAPLVTDYVVTNTNDTGAGSLRAAIDFANLNPGTTISFDIPDTDLGYQTDGTDHWWRIAPTPVGLPAISANGTTIDGSTQTTNRGDVNTRGPEVEIHGISAGAADGLTVSTAGSVVLRDLAVTGFTGNGIQINGVGAAGNAVYGCYVGIDAFGVAALANTGYGIWVTNGANDTDIGSPAVGEGNVISGNGNFGVYIDSGSQNRVRGNKIGVDAAGTAAVSNTGYGLVIGGTATDVTIGGSATGAGNVVAGNGAQITIEDSASSITLHGNIVGTDPSGTIDLSNGRGIELDSAANPSNIDVGGLLPGEGNLIAYNTSGIMGWWSGAGQRILGNTIRDNSSGGMALYMPDVTVAGNLILNNGSQGIYVATGAVGTKVFHNTIHGNSNTGVEVATDGDISLNNNVITGNGSYGFWLNGGTLIVESNNLITDDVTNPPNVMRSNIALDASDLNADPLYVNAAGGDYSLTECTSPAVNTGLDLGTEQPDMNGALPGNYTGAAPDMGALESGCSAAGVAIAGRVFEDADFAGTASEYDGGTGDLALANVDVELYDGADGYLASATTDANGNYAFTGLADGTYKVRVRSATLGDADTPPAGGLNASVPATWPYPLAEMTWAMGAALYGGQVATADDTDTGDDLGPGDTWVAVTLSGTGVSGVNFGFAYNLIVNAADDGLADASPSGQGSLRQFLKNANAIGATGGTTANSSEFRMQAAANGSDAADSWWRISPVTTLPTLTDPGTAVDGASQSANGGDSNSRGPEIEIDGAAIVDSYGLKVTSADNLIHGLVLNGCSSAPGCGVLLEGASTTGTQITGCYVGTNAVGDAKVANFYGIWLSTGPSGTVIGGSGAGEGNVISGNTFYGVRMTDAGANTTILGNRIGTNATGDAAITNSQGLYLDGGAATVIGGPGVGEGNLISGNILHGVNLQSTSDVTIQGNWMGLNLAGTDPLPNGSTAIYGAGTTNNVTVGGPAPGEGNILAGNDGFGISTAMGARDWVIQGNTIGTGPLGTETNLGNAGDANVRISANDITIDVKIGGENPGEGNLIAYGSGPGIICPSLGAAVEIIGNVIRNNAEEGINARVDSLTVAMNVIYDNGAGFDGILIGDVASDGKIYQNTIHGSGDDGIEIVGLGHEIRNNIITGSGGYGINVNGGTMTESHNLVTGAATSPANVLGRSNVALDASDPDADPLYVDEAGGDVALTECASPAINTGTDLGVDQPDMNGIDPGSYNGTAPDMGALESGCSGPALTDSDGDGLWDNEEDANTDLDDDPSTNPGPDTDGDTFANYLDADDDDDGTPTSAESADPNGDGDPRDAVDSDRDGQPDYLDAPTGVANGTVASEQKISSSDGGLGAVLDDSDFFGCGVGGIGDLDGDGVNDIVVGAEYDGDGGTRRGAVYVLFLNSDGTVGGQQKISDLAGGFSAALVDSDYFGAAVAGIGDLDGDGVPDVAVGAPGDDDGGLEYGAVYVLLLNADGTVKSEQKISASAGGFTGPLAGADRFGGAVAGIGDLDGDGINDLAVGAYGDDDGGSDQGAVYVLFLAADGTVKSEQKISSSAGGLGAVLANSDFFGTSVGGLGDLDSDGLNDLVVGANGDDDGGTFRGAVHVLFLNGDGTVKAHQKISSTAGGLPAVLDDTDLFGTSVVGVGDVDADGFADAAAGAYGDDDGGSARGAAYLLFLNGDGTVKSIQKFSSTAGGVTGPLDDGDYFGMALGATGDLDGGGTIDLAVGAERDDDGGTDRGAVYVLDLAGSGSYDITGRVFEDADFAGIATAYDGGTTDLALPNVDVELYTGADAFVATTITDGSGAFSFTGLADGSYKVRVRSATVGDPDTPPAGGLNATVPGTWPYPLPELSWANGGALLGGQDAIVDDTATGDDAGPGDTWVPVTVSGADVSAVDFGFAYNLIVNTADDGLADNTRSDQGSLRQFIKNANAIGSAGGTTANVSEVRIPGVGPYTIQPANALPSLADPATLDGDDGGGRLIIDGTAAGDVSGVRVSSSDVVVTNLVVQNFVGATSTGVWIGDGTTNVTLDNCVSQGHGVDGIRVDWLGVDTDLGHTINACTVSGNGHDGIVLINADGVAITGCVIETSARHGMNVVGANNGSGNNLIDGNTIQGNGVHGVSIWDTGSTNNTFQTNIFRGNNGDGIRVGTGGDSTLFYHNTFDDNGTGGSGSGINVNPGVSGVFIRNSLFTNHSHYGVLDNDGGASTSIDYSGFYGNATADCNYDCFTGSQNATADPLYAAPGPPTSFDLTECTSPAIDAGLDLGASQPDLNGAAAGNFNGAAPDMGARETSCAASTHTIAGRVFEDADFAGTSSGYDGGTNDLALSNVDVELYTGADVFVATTTSDGSGAFAFSGLADGSYKVRVRSATIGDADTSPAGGLNASVPATWPYPLAEMTWGDGAAKLGGQDPTIDDTDTGDDAGPGDTWVAVTVSGASVSGLEFGFAYNPIVNLEDDGLADDARSDQGSLRQFLKNANAIGSAGGTTANYAQFDLKVAANQSGSGQTWWRFSPPVALPSLADGGTTLDGSTQTVNGGDDNTMGPEVEIDGSGAVAVDGLVLTSDLNEVWELSIIGFGDTNQSGIRIDGAAATNNKVAGCYIGLEADGAAAVANYHGIEITGPSNTIGGSTPVERNLLSGNTANAVFLSGGDADGNTISGNYFGTDPSGTGPFLNSTGIMVNGGAGNVIGGSTPGERNVIAGNTSYGVYLLGAGTRDNQVLGNYVGIDATGSAAIGSIIGVYVTSGARANTIGGTVVGDRNVIGGNNQGVTFNGANADSNVVFGNYIGTDDAGTTAVGNGTGVRIAGAAAWNRIGGSTAAERNLISGNGGAGVVLTDAGTDFNTVSGNYVGTDLSGNNALANGGDGILIQSGASDATIGGTAPGAGNLISGNGNAGVYVAGAASSVIVIQGNVIGLQSTGDAVLGNGNDGIILDAAVGVKIGGTESGAGNVISGNLDVGNLADGIWVTGGSAHIVQGNYLGTDAGGTLDLGNYNAGITLTNSSDNLIGGPLDGAGNVIAHNGNFGINLLSGGSGNSFLRNSIFDAGGLGIDLAGDGVTENDSPDDDTGPNNLLNFPEITSAVVNGANVDVQFELEVPVGDYRIEFFTNPDGVDGSGNGEGQAFADSVTITHGGTGLESFAHSFPGAEGDILTATATEEYAPGDYGSTSEFAANVFAVNANTPPVARDDPGGYASLLASYGPAGWWRLGESSGTTAVDQGSAANDGAYTSAFLGEAAGLVNDVDTAMRLDGSGHVEIPHDPAYLIDEGAVQLWFRVTAWPSSSDGLFSKDSMDFDTGGHLNVTLLSSGRVEARIQSVSDEATITASSPSSVDEWHHVLVAFGPAGFRLYVDGSLAASDPWATGLGTSSGGAGNLEPIAFGASTISSDDLVITPLTEPFTGWLDEMAIFAGSMEDADARALYLTGADRFEAIAGVPLVIPADRGVLRNDTDAEGSPLTASLVSGPANAASFSLAGDGSFTYTANGGFSGTDSFLYEAVDGDLATGQATATIDVGLPTFTIAGVVFEDADFAGTATGYDGGTNDLALSNVDVELYTGADAFVATTTTDGSGVFTFTGLADGGYKVRVRSATIGDADTPPAGGLNASVPATWPYPVAEMTWAHGVALVGGQDAVFDDLDTGDDLGPGDTWAAVTVSGGDVTGVNLGFAYNLIVNTADDGLADNARSDQGSLRQFIKNANAIGTAGATTASSSQFHLQVATNQTDGADDWWRITSASPMPFLADDATVLDGSTQRVNGGVDSNARGPEIELFGIGVTGMGLRIDNATTVRVQELTVNGFSSFGIAVVGAASSANEILGCYVGTDAVGEAPVGNGGGGVLLDSNTTSAVVGGINAGEGNLISGNTGAGIQILSSSDNQIRGNLVGTDRSGTAVLANSGNGIYVNGTASGNIIGGPAAGAGNIVSGNLAAGIWMDFGQTGVVVQGNTVGTGPAGSELGLGNGLTGIRVSVLTEPANVTVGGLGSGEGNLVAHNGEAGLYTVNSGSGLEFLGNIVRNNGGGGIYSRTVGLLVAGNLVHDNTGAFAGIRLADEFGSAGSNNQVFHNTVHANGADGILVEATGAAIQNNAVTGNAGFGINAAVALVSESNNLVTGAATSPANLAGRSNVALDVSDLDADPLYVDAAGGIFLPTECTSPAANAGVDLGIDQPDMNGAAAGLYNGSAPDMGALETNCSDTNVDLRIAKTVDRTNPNEGETVTYTVTVTNDGPSTGTGIAVTDLLPAGVTYVSDVPSQGSYVSATGVWTVGSLTNAASATLDIAATVDAGTAGVVINNTASVTALDQTDPTPGNDSGMATLVVQSVDLQVTKSVDESAPNENDTVIYTITVKNNGPSTATGVAITDSFPAGVTYVSASPSQGSYDDGTGVWTVGTITTDSDGPALDLTFTVDVGTAGTTLVNTAELTGSDQADINNINDLANASITVQAVDLQVMKSVDDAAPDEGSTIVYTVTLTNNGPHGGTGIQVTDLLPAGVTYVSDAASQGSYVSGTGVWTVGGLTNAASATLDITATVDAGTVGTTINNTASVTALDQTDPVNGNDSATAGLIVSSVDLQVSKAIDNATPNESDTVTYTVTVANNGPHDGTGIQITDLLPTGVTYVSDAASQGSYVSGTGVWTVGDLANAAIATLDITATVDTGTAGNTVDNTASITALDQTDPVNGNDSAAVGLTVNSVDLQVSKAVDNATPNESDTIVYTVTVTNNGPHDGTAIQVTDLLPAGVTYVSDAASQGSYVSGTGVWTVGSLTNAAIVTLDITATVDAGTAGTTIDNTASVTALDQTDPVNGNDSATVGLIVSSVDLQVSKTIDTATPNEGDTVTYTVTVTNNGPHDGTGIQVTDLLPAGVTYVSDTASQGSYVSATGVWTVGDLANTVGATLDIAATVDTGTAGNTVNNTASITALDQTDPVNGNDSAAVGLTVNIVDLQVFKTVDNATPDEGDTVTYTVTVTNNGPHAGTGIRVTDLLPTGVTYVSATASQGSYVSGTGVWTVGDLANAAGATLDITATVNAGTAGTAITNTASITASDQTDPVSDNNVAAVMISVVQVDLQVTKTVDLTLPMENDRITYTVLVTNRGPTDATGIQLADTLPAGLTFSDANATHGSYNTLTGHWSVGSLNVDEAATLTLDALVNPGTSGSTITNTAMVTAVAEPDSDPDNDSDSVDITVTRFRAGFVYAVATQPDPITILPGAAAQETFRLTIHNVTAQAETLITATVTNTATGPPLQSQRDQEWSELSLYRVEGMPVPTLVPVSTPVSFAGGSATFSGIDTECAPGDSLVFVIEGAPTLVAGDTDVLDLEITDATGLTFGQAVPMTADWPLAPDGYWTVNGMVAAQADLDPVGPGNLQVESTRNLALNVVLPANGFVPDELSRLNVANLGTALPGEDLAATEAWADDGDGLFDPATDVRLGEFSFTGGRWELTGLAYAIPLSGSRIFVSVDIAPLAQVGRTVQLSLPTLPDVGVGMSSDNDGPIDAPLDNPVALTISAVDRVTFSAVGVPDGIARPGESGVTLLHVVATNGYSIPKRVRAVSFANVSEGFGSQMDLDRQIQQLSLRLDGDGDGMLGDLSVDPIIGIGMFDSGRATIDGVTWDLPAETSQHAFLTANVSLLEATDDNVLGAVVAEGQDVAFEDPTAITANWPLDSGSRWTVDGMIAGQITNHGAPVATLGPGDGPVLALDVTIPANGYLDDQLNAVRVVNLGTARDITDLQELRLWRDDGNGQLDGPGVDIDLGALTWDGSGWDSPFLSEDVGLGGARLFVGIEISATPTDSATVRLSIPTDGLVVASGNDGPVDASVENPHGQLISASPLLSTIELSPSVSTPGTAVQARMVVRNVGTESVLGVAPSVLSPVGDGGLVAVSGPTPASFDLSVGAVDTFTWSFDAAQLGEVRLVGNAQGVGGSTSLTRESTPTESNDHLVLQEAAEIDLFAVGTMPTSANRDESEIVAFNLTFTNPAGPSGSDVLLRHLRVRLEDETATPIVPAEVLSRVVLSEGSNVYLVKTDLETSGSDVDLSLVSPARITTLEPVTVSISFDLVANTGVPRFHMMLWDDTSVEAEGAVSGNPVLLNLEEGSYPVSSGFMNLMSGAVELQATGNSVGAIRVEPGHTDVVLLEVDLENVDTGLLTSDVQLAGFTVEFADTQGVALPDVTPWIQRIHVRGPDETHLIQTMAPGARLDLDLSPVLFLPAGTSRGVTITADLQEDAPPGVLRLHLPDRTLVQSTDANSGDAVPTTFPEGSVVGSTVFVETPASLAMVEGRGFLPATVTVGTMDLTAMSISVRHPGSAGTARIRLDGLTLDVRDQSGTPVVPANVLSGARLLRDGTQLGNVPEPPTSGSTVAIGLSGVILAPGETATVEVVVDVNAVASATSLELRARAEGFLLADDNTGAVVSVKPESGASLPISSGVSLLRVPPRQLMVRLESRLPTVLAADGGEIVAGVFTLSNTAPVGSGPIQLESLGLTGADREFTALALGRAVTALSLHHAGSTWASASGLTENDVDVTLTGVQPLELQPGEPLELELRVTLAGRNGAESIRFGVRSDDLGVIQPQSALLQIEVAAGQGQDFPLWTSAGTLASTDLAGSYANFPNPFAAGRENTSFVYFLEEPGRVTLTIWTSRGEKVITLLRGESRDPGLHQADAWDGRNGRGRAVINDVFLAELVVDYDSGRSERAVRKVAVVR